MSGVELHGVLATLRIDGASVLLQGACWLTNMELHEYITEAERVRMLGFDHDQFTTDKTTSVHSPLVFELRVESTGTPVTRHFQRARIEA